MMTFNQWAENKPNLFTELNKKYPSSFIDEFGEEQLYTLYKITQGNKPIASSVCDLSMPEVAELVGLSFSHIWDTQYKYFRDNMELGLVEENTVTETETDDSERIGTTVQTNQTSAFNEVDLSLTDEDSDSVNDSTTRTTSRERTDKKRRFSDVDNQIALLNKNFVVNTICKDISGIVSLSVY